MRHFVTKSILLFLVALSCTEEQLNYQSLNQEMLNEFIRGKIAHKKATNSNETLTPKIVEFMKQYGYKEVPKNSAKFQTILETLLQQNPAARKLYMECDLDLTIIHDESDGGCCVAVYEYHNGCGAYDGCVANQWCCDCVSNGTWWSEKVYIC